ncbi:alpha/beta hydrolase [Mycobacterium sp.]|uniref:alpha/beta fold hydrolase n=1 Tax=Mycobacterium sp. TaxID=1785 RepID=UPI0025DF69A9|nr:alpha/beta hydrolase [Mycobacterium sp.]MBW0014480.1 alpha/beta hydrolase [Mycobacterium sp.]
MWDVDGRCIFAAEAGSGEPVLLLHGYPQSGSCWRHQIASLAGGHHVVAPDWPGFGRSDSPATVPTYDNEIDRIERLVQRLGWERFNLCAHDYGGFIALGYVIRHPRRVLRLALLNTRAHGVFRPWFYRFSAKHLPLYLGWMSTPQGRRTFWEFFAHYPVPAVPWLAEGLAAIRCPVSVIWSDRDPFIPFNTARELADRIPHASLTRLRGAGHYIMEERPREVTDAVLSLLSMAPVASR